MKAYRFLILILILACFIFAFASCNEDEEQAEPTDTGVDTGTGDATEGAEDGTEAPTSKPEPTEGKYPIYLGGEYVCKAVYPEKATEVEKDIYKKVRERFKNFTGELPSINTDFLAYNDTGESRSEPAILVGKTNYEESKQVYETLSYGESKIEIVGNKLVIAFSSDMGADQIYLKFLGLMREASAERIEVDGDLDISVVYNEMLSSVPLYPFSNSEVITGELDSFLICAEEATLEQFDEYCKLVEDAGYTHKERKVIGDNVFVTLMNDTSYIYTYFTKHDSYVRIAGGPLSIYAEADNSSGLEENYTPYIASIPQPGNGQGYIFRLPDGRFIIHDGGYSGGDRVYNTLRELEEGDITIAAWFISHPHADHYPALRDFVQDHGKDEDITLEKVLFNYADSDVYDLSDSAGKENLSQAVKNTYSVLKSYVPDTEIIKVHTGQTLNFGSVSIEVIYTVEDILPRVLPNINDSSLVIRVTVDGQSLMMLADTCYDSAPIMCNMWGDYLKSDILQMAHHGVWPAQPDIYHLIQGETVLFPATHANMKNDLFDTRWGATTQAALKYASDIYISGDSVQVIILPHAIENNKEATMEYVRTYGDAPTE